MRQYIASILWLSGVASAASAASPTVASPRSLQPGDALNFVACPMVRDTAHPCWVAEHEGELYFLGVQGSSRSAFYPPQLNHKALIEGVISDKPRICGGIVLEPVKVSTMRELDRSCNSILPAEGHIIETDERGPTPDHIQPGRATRAKASLPAAAERREFVISYDFDRENPWIGPAIRIGDAADFAQAINASRVEVIGYRGFAQLTSGEVLEELPHLSQLRARRVADALIDIGIPPAKLTVTHEDNAVGPQPEKRRVVIIVTP